MKPSTELLAAIERGITARRKLRLLCEDVATVDARRTEIAVKEVRRAIASADHRVFFAVCYELGLNPMGADDSASLSATSGTPETRSLP